LVRAACRFDASRATYDFIRLLNTNFDSPSIYWALVIIFKELWRLETAAVWFEQMLLFPAVSQELKAKAYLELADSFIWQGRNLPKAIEYAKISLDIDARKDPRTLRVLAHAHLKAGQIRQAQLYLDQTDSDSDHEVRYLRGLLIYRNGDRIKANEIWKPLLTVRTESLRFHNIKQEVLKFYFEGTPYLKAN
jgi:tetratricopeptide (TPR) repeat protein